VAGRIDRDPLLPLHVSIRIQPDLPSIAAGFETFIVQVITAGYGAASLVRVRDGLSEGFLICPALSPGGGRGKKARGGPRG
jgi:hypothetical protein